MVVSVEAGVWRKVIPPTPASAESGMGRFSCAGSVGLLWHDVGGGSL